MEKGIALTFSTIVMLAVAVLVLIALVAFFMYGMRQRESLEMQQAINEVCMRFSNLGCDKDAYNAVRRTVLPNNQTVDGFFMGISSLQVRCGCSGKTKTLICDVDGNGFVDSMDFLAIGYLIGTTSKDRNYVSEADANRDGRIDEHDVELCKERYGIGK